MSTHELWVEGYAATGEHGTAQCLGTWPGETLGEAVKAWNAAKNPDGKQFGVLKFNAETGYWSVWGCRIFDNRRDAQEGFG